jgi:hypothetical protein
VLIRLEWGKGEEQKEKKSTERNRQGFLSLPNVAFLLKVHEVIPGTYTKIFLGYAGPRCGGYSFIAIVRGIMVHVAS